MVLAQIHMATNIHLFFTQSNNLSEFFCYTHHHGYKIWPIKLRVSYNRHGYIEPWLHKLTNQADEQSITNFESYILRPVVNGINKVCKKKNIKT